MAIRKIKLSKKREKYAKEREKTDGYYVGGKVELNRAWQLKQAKKIESLIREMHLSVSKSIMQEINSGTSKEYFSMDESITKKSRRAIRKISKRWEDTFNLWGDEFADTLIEDTSERQAVDLQKSLKELTDGITIRTDMISKKTKEILKAGTEESVSLIKTIPQSYFAEVEQGLMRSIVSKQNFTQTKENIHQLLQSRYKKHRNKAKNIVLDQTSKIYNSLTAQRSQDAGIKKFKWRHAGGTKEPRKLHKYKLNNNIYSYDDLPVIDERTGERGLPGQAINCKCYQEPVFEFEQMEDK